MKRFGQRMKYLLLSVFIVPSFFPLKVKVIEPNPNTPLQAKPYGHHVDVIPRTY